MNLSGRTFQRLIATTGVVLVVVLLWVGSRGATDVVRQADRSSQSTETSTASTVGRQEPVPATSADTTGMSPRATIRTSAPQAELAPSILAESIKARRAQLEELEHKGSAKAECVLGIDSATCLGLPMLRDRIRGLEAEAAKAGAGSSEESSAVSEIKTLDREIKQLEASCGSELDYSSEKSWGHLLKAARNGSESATLFMALSPPMRQDNALRNIEQWTEYKAELPLLLRDAAHNGNIQALWLSYGIASGEDLMPGGAAFGPPNQQLALTYAIALRSLVDHPGLVGKFGRAIAELRTQLPESEFKRAEHAASQILSRVREGERIKSFSSVSGIPGSEQCLG